MLNAQSIADGIEAEIQRHEARGTRARLACEGILTAALATGREELTPEEQREFDLYSKQFDDAARAVDGLADRLEALNESALGFNRIMARMGRN